MVISKIKGKNIPKNLRKDWLNHTRFKIVSGLSKAKTLSNEKRMMRTRGKFAQFTDIGLRGKKLQRGKFLVTWKPQKKKR